MKQKACNTRNKDEAKGWNKYVNVKKQTWNITPRCVKASRFWWFQLCFGVIFQNRCDESYPFCLNWFCWGLATNRPQSKLLTLRASRWWTNFRLAQVGLWIFPVGAPLWLQLLLLDSGHLAKPALATQQELFSGQAPRLQTPCGPETWLKVKPHQ